MNAFVMDGADPLASFAQPDALSVLAREHARLMRLGHREIQWKALEVEALPSQTRSDLAALWRSTGEAEHRSAGIFATYVLDLMAAGAPLEFLSIASRATLDEVRHADVAFRLASYYSGTPEFPTAGMPRVPDRPSFTPQEQALFQTLFLLVGAETFSSVMLTDALEHSSHPTVRDVYSVILGDEVHHARLGWGYLGHLLRDSTTATWARAFVQENLVEAFEILHRSLFDDPETLPAPTLRGRAAAVAQAHGYRPVREQYKLFVHSLNEIWVPGFAQLGFDVEVLTRHFAVPSWMKTSRRRKR